MSKRKPQQSSRTTTAAAILFEVARMRKHGTLDDKLLCWNARDLEALAMFAIDAKNRLEYAAPTQRSA